MTVGSRSRNTALSTCFPDPVSLKKVPKEESICSVVLLLRVILSGWILWFPTTIAPLDSNLATMDRNTLLLDRKRKEKEGLQDLEITVNVDIYSWHPFNQATICDSLLESTGNTFFVKIGSPGWREMYFRADVRHVSPISSILTAMPLQVRLEASHPSHSTASPLKPRLINHAVQSCGQVLNRKDTTAHLTQYLREKVSY